MSYFNLAKNVIFYKKVCKIGQNNAFFKLIILKVCVLHELIK
jgi:hypothetical protein